MKQLNEPNYEQILKSYVRKLQDDYSEYRKLLNRYYQLTGFDDEGVFYTVKGSELMLEKTMKLAQEMEGLKYEIEDLKKKVNGYD